MDLDWNAVLTAEGVSTWIRITVWIGVACAFWVFAMLLRGGFDDMFDVIRSPYATAGERTRMMMRLPTRFILIVIAALAGAAGFAIPLFIQGAVVLFLWRQVTGG
ncbi:hypothetical protein [Oceanicaulis sp. MMSF_3324]|uniref:hypothetical protein n=1 Tax=Oceanicaulis sp. MMSF_3324 TaxID=3046702 RepID=UPI00273EAA68|nr:hypothetical protein [Oceanicaulis sp. MMSF_3324]